MGDGVSEGVDVVGAVMAVAGFAGGGCEVAARVFWRSLCLGVWRSSPLPGAVRQLSQLCSVHDGDSRPFVENHDVRVS